MEIDFSIDSRMNLEWHFKDRTDRLKDGFYIIQTLLWQKEGNKEAVVW